MNRQTIEAFLNSYTGLQSRTIVIVDFGNVDKWERSLGWPVDIKALGRLAKNFSRGSRYLRRFYYGSDYGPDELSLNMKQWSKSVLRTAAWSGFRVLTKKVKYIRSLGNPYGYEKKCDLDVEITVDLIKESNSYDMLVLFSGDGDFVCPLEYLCRNFGKRVVVFGARNHIGREIYDARRKRIVERIYYAEDFKYLLDPRGR